MLSSSQISNIAEDLVTAEKNCTQIGLLTQEFPQMDMDDAYSVQKAILAHKLAAGRQVIGWKIGLTSKAMQSALNIDIPDSGILFDDMLFANGATIQKGRFIQPRIEAEIAFVMKSSISGNTVTRQDVIDATDYVVPSLEILDTRIIRSDSKTGKIRTVIDTISDNAANAGIVLGAEKNKLNDFDIRWVGAICSRNGEVEETGLGAGVLNDPVKSVVWLARRMANYDLEIKAGDVILSGSFIRPVEAIPGASFNADFGAFGSVNCTFE